MSHRYWPPPTLPDRATHARQAKLARLEFLELLLQDEIDRRDSQGLRRVEAVTGKSLGLAALPGISV